MAEKRLKAFCPCCDMRWFEGEPKPEHKADCPWLGKDFPMVVFWPRELGVDS